MREDGKLDYLEMPGGDLPALKTFYSQAFGWTFTDYGPQYAAFSEGLDGGFQSQSEERAAQPLPVLFAKDIEAMLAKVQAAGGVVIKPIFEFPGGKRFHFRDPAGNELAVWSNSIS